MPGRKENTPPRYLPTLEEIYMEAEKIRRGWSKERYKVSGGGNHAVEAVIPSINPRGRRKNLKASSESIY